jgi:hypothetical protein
MPRASSGGCGVTVSEFTMEANLKVEANMKAQRQRRASAFSVLKLTVAGLAVAVALALTGCGGARTRGATTVGLSGLELFSGTSAGNVATSGTLFAGKDNSVCNCWTTSDSGGAWTASVSYTGQPGIGSSGVTVTGGKWLWQQASDVIHSGKVRAGRVRWPASIDADPFGCGKGVASISLSLAGLSEEGSFTGCLDDTHLDPRAQPFVFPPQDLGHVDAPG